MRTMTEIGRDWHTTYDVKPGHDRSVEYLIERGTYDANRYFSQGVVCEVLEPGGGYLYAIVLHDLLRAEASVLANGIEPSWNERRMAGAFGVPKAVGGEMLVSLPHFHACTVLNQGTFHTPDYLDEKLRMGTEHTVPLGIYLSALSQAVMERRREQP